MNAKDKAALTLVIDTGAAKPLRIAPIGYMADMAKARATLASLAGQRAKGSAPIFAYYERLGGDKACGAVRDILGQVREYHNVA